LTISAPRSWKKRIWCSLAASFAESDGTVVNNEGRAQRFFQVYDPSYYERTP
jgi:predicted molibdopterin-dependent oxidoreductase YjgC